MMFDQDLIINQQFGDVLILLHLMWAFSRHISNHESV